MSSNYPPGVSGGEYEISGPEEEQNADLFCAEPSCGYEGPVTVHIHGSEVWFDCPVCEGRTDVDPEDL